MSVNMTYIDPMGIIFRFYDCNDLIDKPPCSSGFAVEIRFSWEVLLSTQLVIWAAQPSTAQHGVFRRQLVLQLGQR